MLCDAVTAQETLGFPDYTVEKLQPHLPAAEKKLLELFGSDLYQSLLDAPADDPIRQDAVLANAYLAGYYALPFLNLKPSELGGFTTQTGFEASLNTIMSKRELDDYRKSMYNTAMIFVQAALEAWNEAQETEADETRADLGGINFTAI